jgi:hypothetical protein
MGDGKAMERVRLIVVHLSHDMVPAFPSAKSGLFSYTKEIKQ